MTETQFRDNQVLREELRKLLENATLKTALEIVAGKAKPRVIPDPKANAHLDTLTSQHYYRLVGIQQAVDAIERLTEPNSEGLSDDEKMEEKFPFFANLPAEMKAALRKQMSDQA